MTSVQLAKVAAKGLLDMAHEEGFDTFAEMKKCYWYDAADVREEIRAALELAGWYVMYDNGKEIECDDHPYNIMYGAFKKLVMAELKALEKENDDLDDEDDENEEV